MVRLITAHNLMSWLLPCLIVVAVISSTAIVRVDRSSGMILISSSDFVQILNKDMEVNSTITFHISPASSRSSQPDATVSHMSLIADQSDCDKMTRNSILICMSSGTCRIASANSGKLVTESRRRAYGDSPALHLPTNFVNQPHVCSAYPFGHNSSSMIHSTVVDCRHLAGPQLLRVPSIDLKKKLQSSVAAIRMLPFRGDHYQSSQHSIIIEPKAIFEYNEFLFVLSLKKISTDEPMKLVLSRMCMNEVSLLNSYVQVPVELASSSSDKDQDYAKTKTTMPKLGTINSVLLIQNRNGTTLGIVADRMLSLFNMVDVMDTFRENQHRCYVDGGVMRGMDYLKPDEMCPGIQTSSPLPDDSEDTCQPVPGYPYPLEGRIPVKVNQKVIISADNCLKMIYVRDLSCILILSWNDRNSRYVLEFWMDNTVALMQTMVMANDLTHPTDIAYSHIDNSVVIASNNKIRKFKLSNCLMITMKILCNRHSRCCWSASFNRCLDTFYTSRTATKIQTTIPVIKTTRTSRTMNQSHISFNIYTDPIRFANPVEKGLQCRIGSVQTGIVAIHTDYMSCSVESSHKTVNHDSHRDMNVTLYAIEGGHVYDLVTTTYKSEVDTCNNLAKLPLSDTRDVVQINTFQISLSLDGCTSRDLFMVFGRGRKDDTACRCYVMNDVCLTCEMTPEQTLSWNGGVICCGLNSIAKISVNQMLQHKDNSQPPGNRSASRSRPRRVMEQLSGVDAIIALQNTDVASQKRAGKHNAIDRQRYIFLSTLTLCSCICVSLVLGYLLLLWRSGQDQKNSKLKRERNRRGLVWTLLSAASDCLPYSQSTRTSSNSVPMIVRKMDLSRSLCYNMDVALQKLPVTQRTAVYRIFTYGLYRQRNDKLTNMLLHMWTNSELSNYFVSFYLEWIWIEYADDPYQIFIKNQDLLRRRPSFRSVDTSETVDYEECLNGTVDNLVNISDNLTGFKMIRCDYVYNCPNASTNAVNYQTLNGNEKHGNNGLSFDPSCSYCTSSVDDSERSYVSLLPPQSTTVTTSAQGRPLKFNFISSPEARFGKPCLCRILRRVLTSANVDCGGGSKGPSEYFKELTNLLIYRLIDDAFLVNHSNTSMKKTINKQSYLSKLSPLQMLDYCISILNIAV